MPLDKEFFDTVHIDLVKKKYYNANKVNALLEEIRAQALEMNDENARMRAQLDLLLSQKDEIGEAVISAQQIYRDIIGKARARASEIIGEAEHERDEIIAEGARRQDRAVQRVESCFSAIREQHLAAIDAINAEWQDFLCGLYEDETEDGDTESTQAEDSLPDDIDEKLVALSQSMSDI